MDRGAGDAQVLLIGIAPSGAAVSQGKAFAGNSRARLLTWFADAGFAMTDEQLSASIYMTSLVKCGAAPDSASTRRRMWARCDHFLWRQLEIVRPKLIVSLGQEPLEMATQQRGSMEELVGRVWPIEDLFEGQLFRPNCPGSIWLAMPHPSGLSRVMNKPLVREAAIRALRRSLDAVNFQIQ